MCACFGVFVCCCLLVRHVLIFSSATVCAADTEAAVESVVSAGQHSMLGKQIECRRALPRRSRNSRSGFQVGNKSLWSGQTKQSSNEQSIHTPMPTLGRATREVAAAGAAVAAAGAAVEVGAVGGTASTG